EHYAASDKVKKDMEAEKKVFVTLGQEMLACVADIKKMYDRGQVNQRLAKQQIEKFGRNIEDMMIYLDGVERFSLEGKGNSKEEQAEEGRPLWNRLCYHLVQLFRLLFTILSFGLFRKENPLAKKLGSGAFFLYKIKTTAEKDDIKQQDATLKSLSHSLSSMKDKLDGLVEEVNALGNSKTNDLS
ncbi:MAG: hypothetical protein P1U32_04845, partial [Legionellaceae bacterium]|nr:hypothetical protein [Legionellaceae bacterium]